MAQFLNNFMAVNNLDGLVPTLELEDLYQEDGPLLKDHFLGVDTRSGDQPLCVVFVDPNTNTNDELHGNNNNNNGFYDEYTAPSWLENNVDLNDLDSMVTTFSPADSVSTVPFVEPPASQNFIPDTYDFSPKVPYSRETKIAQPVQQIQPQMKKTQAERSELEYSDSYYDASAEASVASVYSTTSWTSTEEEYPSKEAILEEIHREAAQIERFSVSPPAVKSSVRKTHNTIRKAPKPQKQRSQTKIPKSFVERKKELNRQAATKYREKKRTEREHLHVERESLETRNTELKAEVSAMASEIEYLKKLIKDIEARTKH
uniref:BZIP domain-containing protein n=1 Tax=Acrobeloides nanus TaxID=290746 RepID=A0A914E929_9BILA